jgi:hypothetical protein
MNFCSVFYHSIQNILSSCLLSKTIQIRKHKTIILPVVLYQCETLRGEHGEQATEKVLK